MCVCVCAVARAFSRWEFVSKEFLCALAINHKEAPLKLGPTERQRTSEWPVGETFWESLACVRLQLLETEHTRHSPGETRDETRRDGTGLDWTRLDETTQRNTI